VAVANYAFSIRADLVVLPPIRRDELFPIQRHVCAWKVDRSVDAYKQLEKMVLDRVGDIDFRRYEFATFFTKGLPYGLILENIIPFTHVLSDIACDRFIFNNIACERMPSNFGSAVVFSPGAMNDEETDDVIQLLDQNKYLVTPLLDEKATVRALREYGEYFPYDVLHVCSHGGETEGYHVVQDFMDRDGRIHRVEYDEVVGFSPARPGRVLLSRKALFRKFDGFAWMSPELKQQDLPLYVFDDMKNALDIDNEAGRTRVPVRGPISGSCHILCHDSIHQGDFVSLSGSGSPFIFNNTCSSWYEIATSFVAAGARGYIGTMWEIENTAAIAAAKAFYREVLSRERLLDGFSEMRASLEQTEDRDIYIFWGLHFSTLRNPTQKSSRKVLDRLSISFRSMLHAFNVTKDMEVKQRYAPILEFIYTELLRGAKGQQLMRLRKMGPGLRRSIASVPARGERSSLMRGELVL